MKKKITKVVDGIESINNELFDEMFVNELETRLETDPLLTNGLLDLMSSQDGGVQPLCQNCNIGYYCSHNE